MLVEDTEERRALRDTARRYLGQAAPVGWARERGDLPVTAADPVWKGFAELGVLGCLVPPAYGGLGLGMSDLGGVLEEVGRVAFPGPVASTAVAAAWAVRALGAAADHEALLPQLAEGAATACLALLEPGSRYDWTSPATIADGGRVTGQKVHVPDVTGSDVILVSTRDEQGIGLYVVERDAPGVTIRAVSTVDTTRPQGTVELVSVPAHRLGSGDASAGIAATVDRVTAAVLADGLGAAGRALELALEHARTRHQFGVPIGTFQAVQHLCTDMYTRLELARGGVAHALASLDCAPPDDAHRAVVMAQAWAAEAYPAIGQMAVQVLGGLGFTWEHDIGWLYKRLLGVEASGGGAPERLAELADLLLP